MRETFDLSSPRCETNQAGSQNVTAVASFALPDLGIIDARPSATARGLESGPACEGPVHAVAPTGNLSAGKKRMTRSVSAAPEDENDTMPKTPLIDVEEFAAQLACSPKHIRRMADSGRCPPAIQLGSLRRWNRQVVDEWIAAGCPVVRQARMGGRK
jgi:excisionase family DNA binding protein